MSWHVFVNSFTPPSPVTPPTFLPSSTSSPCCALSSSPSLPGLLPAGSTVQEVRFPPKTASERTGLHLIAPQSLLTCTRFASRAAVPLPALKRPNFSWGTRLFPIYARTGNSRETSSPNQGLRRCHQIHAVETPYEHWHHWYVDLYVP